jgi:hypothetical protein
MNEDAFVALVVNNAPRYEIEVLEKIIRELTNQIASRRWGKPAGLTIGSKVEATMFDTNWVQYGAVVSLSPKSCTIEDPDDARRTTRILYSKYAIRILDTFEWNRISMSLTDHRKAIREKVDSEAKDRAADREDAIRERSRSSKKPIEMQALNGTVSLFRGAFVHAFRPDWGDHDYGIVVSLSPKKIILSSPESDWESSILASKKEIHVLSDSEWRVVDIELRRRRREYEDAKAVGREQEIRDYGTEAIALEAQPK